MGGYFECTACWVRSAMPVGFDERIHFVYCPKCNQPMCHTPGTPEQNGMARAEEVKGRVGSQR